MPQTLNHNRDFKDDGITYSGNSSSRKFSNIRHSYWILPVAIVAMTTVFSGRYQNTDEADKSATKVELADISVSDLLAENARQTEEELTALTDKPDTSSQSTPSTPSTPEPNPIPMLPDVLAHTGTGISFASLLERTPELWKSTKIKKGDTLYVILKRLGLKTAAATLIARSDNSDPLVKLVPGKTLHILSKDGHIGDEYIYENTPLTWVHAKRNENDYVIMSNRLPTTRHIRKVKGEIISSLYAAAKVAGISDPLTMNMTEIFGWDIDFAINVQPGDRFKLIFEDVYVNGNKKSHGDIIAAEFVNNGKTHRAIAHRNEDGDLRYYSPDGKSMQKTFLRTPVKFSRISSRFTKSPPRPAPSSCGRP